MNAAKKIAPRRHLHILLADDESDAIKTLSALLIYEGHTVSAVYSGSQVLDAVRRYKPDVCILDIEMPGQSGYAAARELMEKMPDAERPVLVGISGRWTGPSDRIIAEHVGFARFFLKGNDPGDLLAFLEELANSYGSRDGA